MIDDLEPPEIYFDGLDSVDRECEFREQLDLLAQQVLGGWGVGHGWAGTRHLDYLLDDFAHRYAAFRL